MFGVPVQIRRNCGSVWLFAGMTDKMMFSMIMNQVRLNGKDWWEEYSELNFRDVMIIDWNKNKVNKIIRFLKINY
jgi:hypothetical protein